VPFATSFASFAVKKKSEASTAVKKKKRSIPRT
jgi:hypothetical protein